MTTEQTTIPLGTLTEPDHAPAATIEERFTAFHETNPWVLDSLLTLADDYLTNRPRLSVKMLFEVIRWEYDRATFGDAFRLNNDFHSRYVRLMIARRPDLASSFETRRLRAA